MSESWPRVTTRVRPSGHSIIAAGMVPFMPEQHCTAHARRASRRNSATRMRAVVVAVVFACSMQRVISDHRTDLQRETACAACG